MYRGRVEELTKTEDDAIYTNDHALTVCEGLALRSLLACFALLFRSLSSRFPLRALDAMRCYASLLLHHDRRDRHLHSNREELRNSTQHHNHTSGEIHDPTASIIVSKSHLSRTRPSISALLSLRVARERLRGRRRNSQDIRKIHCNDLISTETK